LTKFFTDKIIISKDETVLLKGMAIIFVLAGHFIPPFLPFSEIYVPVKRVLGQVGVGIFMFISGYGVMLSYILSSGNITSFLRRRFCKLWPLYFVAITLYALLQILLFQESITPGMYLAHLSGLQVYLGYENAIYSASHFISGLITVYAVVSLSLVLQGEGMRVAAAGLLFLLYGAVSLLLLDRLYFTDYIAAFVMGMFIASRSSRRVSWWASFMLLPYLFFVFQYPYNTVKFVCTLLAIPLGLFLGNRLGHDSPVKKYVSLSGISSYTIYLSHNYFVWKWPALMDIFGSVSIVGILILASTVLWMGLFFLLAWFLDRYVTPACLEH
jgi:peptidoglycan/LPS O-acetylase OafA/YrhL